MKTILIFGIIFAAILGWFIFSKLSTPPTDIIAQNGLHWHSNLSINILGQPQEIPAGLGLAGLPHNPLHTHDRDSVIHMEFAGKVAADDLRLGKFFQVWGKTFNKDCIFDKCSGPEGTLKMLVNGKENSDFENYAMKDEDKIEIIFEQKESVSGAVKEITVIGKNFFFAPSVITVKSGDKVKINFQNEASIPHNLTIEGLDIKTEFFSEGSGPAVIEFTTPAPGTYTFYCSVPGHKEAGMKGQLIVEEN